MQFHNLHNNKGRTEIELMTTPRSWEECREVQQQQMDESIIQMTQPEGPELKTRSREEEVKEKQHNWWTSRIINTNKPFTPKSKDSSVTYKRECDDKKSY